MFDLSWESKLYKAEMEFALKETGLQNIAAYFYNLKKLKPFLSKLINYFESKDIEFGFLGGSVRTALAGDLMQMPRDVDIIFDGDETEFDNFLKENKIGFLVNSFGGHKIIENGLTFDIWTLANHYLIADEKYSKKFANVPKTTFINYDSIFYNWTKKEVIGEYFDCLATRTIDFVGDENYIELNKFPNITICKIALLCEKEFEISPMVQHWIKEQLKNFVDFDSFIYDYERHMDWGIGKYAKDVIRNFLREFGVTNL